MILFGKKKSDCRDLSETVPPPKQEGKLVYKAANLQGIGKRARQEDSFSFSNALESDPVGEMGMLITVADGMGGMADGKKASEAVIRSISTDFREFDREGDIAAQLEAAVFKAGDEVYSLIGGMGGSTVVTAVIYDEKLYFTSVGDSYIFLMRNRQLVRLNRSQNIQNEMYLETLSDGSTDPSIANSVQQKEALTQFLGMDGLEEADSLVKPLDLLPGDVLLLCSDGVAGYVDETCIAECLSFGVPIDMATALDREIRLADRKYQDNYTALIVQCRK